MSMSSVARSSKSEESTYEHFVQAANYALGRLKKLKADGIIPHDDSDDTNILFHHMTCPSDRNTRAWSRIASLTSSLSRTKPLEKYLKMEENLQRTMAQRASPVSLLRMRQSRSPKGGSNGRMFYRRSSWSANAKRT